MSNGVLEHRVTGNPESKTLLVFLQGWPDTMEMWDYIHPQEALGQYRLLRMNMPNHGKEKIPWGQNFDVLRDRIKKTIDTVNDVDKIVLVAHDWGCLYGYHIDRKHPKYFKHMITMDVPAMLELTSIKAKFLFAAYQLYLIIAFLIGGSIGESMTKKFSKISGHIPPYYNQIKSDMNFPYYYLWRNAILSIFQRKSKQQKGSSKPSVPVAYMYGTHKPAQFHGPRWLKYLQQTEGCEKHSFQAGHWFMKKFKDPVVAIIRRRARL